MLNVEIIKIIQHAYLSGTYDNPFYEGVGIDKDGKKYRIAWNIKECYLPLYKSSPNYKPEYQCTDESDMCDWDNYNVIIQLY